MSTLCQADGFADSRGGIAGNRRETWRALAEQPTGSGPTLGERSSGRLWVRWAAGRVVGQLDRRGDALAHRFAVDTEDLAYRQDDLQAVLPDAAGIHRHYCGRVVPPSHTLTSMAPSLTSRVSRQGPKRLHGRLLQ